MCIICIQNICVGDVWGETAALVHPGLQGSCGDLVFLTARRKRRLSIIVIPPNPNLCILYLLSLYLHDMYDNSHARHCISINCIQHRLGDGLKQVLWLLHDLTHFSNKNTCCQTVQNLDRPHILYKKRRVSNN